MASTILMFTTSPASLTTWRRWDHSEMFPRSWHSQSRGPWWPPAPWSRLSEPATRLRIKWPRWVESLRANQRLWNVMLRPMRGPVLASNLLSSLENRINRLFYKLKILASKWAFHKSRKILFKILRSILSDYRNLVDLVGLFQETWLINKLL